MNQKDEFNKWISAVEEALQTENNPGFKDSPELNNNCGCNSWNCAVCFPSNNDDEKSPPMEISGLELIDEIDEEDNNFIEKPKSGKGVKLGDIVQTTEIRPTGGQNSPLTYGDENLSEELPPGANPEDYGKAGRYLQKHFDDSMEEDSSDSDYAEPWTEKQANDIFSFASMSNRDIEKAELMMHQIINIQNMGFSKDNHQYTEDDFQEMTFPEIKACFDRVMGNESVGIANDNTNSDMQSNTQDVTAQDSMKESRKTAVKPTLLEQIKWDTEINEAYIEESSLSKLIGKQKGGQNLVRWLHRRHKLGNDADLQPAPFSERLLWKEFKSNPDNFVIVTAENGVAGIKPDKKFIDQRTAEFAKKGKPYNPGGDSTLPYQIVAFTDDGQQVDPDLLRAPPEDGEEYKDPRDPTVMRARMGKHNGRDMQNPYNVFNLLAEQIGALRTVYIGGFENVKGGEPKGAVERDKMKARSDLKKSPVMNSDASAQKILQKIKPILGTIIDQALSHAGKNSQNSTVMKLKRLKDNLNNNPAEILSLITDVISQSAESPKGSNEYDEYASQAATGNVMALRPIIDALRTNLINL